MKSYAYIIILCFFFFVLCGSSDAHKIEVPLADLFFAGQNTFYSMETEEGFVSGFKGIPSKNKGGVYTVLLDNDTICVLLYEESPQYYVMKIDWDFNHDFTDDWAYRFYWRDEMESLEFPPLMMNLSRSGHQQKGFPVWLGFRKMKRGDSEDILLIFGRNSWYYGFFSVEGKPYSLFCMKMGSMLKYIIMKGNHYVMGREDLISLIHTKESVSMSESLIDSCFLFHLEGLSTEKHIGELTINKKSSSDKIEGIRDGFISPLFQIRALNGEVIRLKELMGRYVVIDFWGTWCNPCIAALPQLRSLYEKYPPVHFMSIAVEDEAESEKNKSVLNNLIVENRMEWINVLEDRNKEKQPLNQLFKVTSYPTSLLINPEGIIEYRGIGVDALMAIDSILAERITK